ncbi:MAG: NAD-dependent epimerase/dehydratase family protein [Verrucomicrobiales bacterium]|nr:NAD-dependent epimerase/dehydratase family protein [Verrucomicrobiales bacterium]
MSCFLVTGAAGFIGAEVCRQLIALGHQVVGIDNLNDYYDVRLKDWRLSQLLGSGALGIGDNAAHSLYLGAGRQVNGPFTFEYLDIENREKLEALFTEFPFDGVINLAARAGVRYSLENPHVYLSTNTVGTLNLLECQRVHDVKHQVLASTSSLYAGCPVPFREDLPVNTPLSPYAASKKGAEMMAYSYHHLYGLDITVERFFTVFGPAGRPDMSPFRFVKWIAEGTPITLYGDGTQSRDFTYVEDVARGVVLAALNPGGYRILNIGGGRDPIVLNDMIHFIEKALGKKAVIDHKPFHSADMLETAADVTLAKDTLGWSPQVTPEEGFERTVAWYVANKEWLETVTT